MGPDGIPYSGSRSALGVSTDVCADGYTGYACSLCAADYYKSGLFCLSCGLEGSALAQLIGLIFAAVAFFILLAIGVGFLEDRTLIRFVAGLISVQQLIVVGKPVLFCASV